MGNTNIVSDIDSPTIVKIATEINDGIFAHAQLTYMEKLAFPMNARFAPPRIVFRTIASSNCEEGLEQVGKIDSEIPPRGIYIEVILISYAISSVSYIS